MEPQCDGNDDHDNNKKDNTTPPLAADSTAIKYAITPQIQQTVENLRRSTTSLEGKFKCTITSERLTQLKKVVENSIREHKIFTIKGEYWYLL